MKRTCKSCLQVIPIQHLDFKIGIAQIFAGYQFQTNRRPALQNLRHLTYILRQSFKRTATMPDLTKKVIPRLNIFQRTQRRKKIVYLVNRNMSIFQVNASKVIPRPGAFHAPRLQHLIRDHNNTLFDIFRRNFPLFQPKNTKFSGHLPRNFIRDHIDIQRKIGVVDALSIDKKIVHQKTSCPNIRFTAAGHTCCEHDYRHNNPIFIVF